MANVAANGNVSGHGGHGRLGWQDAMNGDENADGPHHAYVDAHAMNRHPDRSFAEAAIPD
jgi:hypothetical protein